MYMSKPVIDSEGNKRWYNDVGQYHRLDGPAVEWCNGDKEWYLNDKEYTEEEFALLQFMNGVNVYV